MLEERQTGRRGSGSDTGTQQRNRNTLADTRAHTGLSAK